MASQVQQETAARGDRPTVWFWLINMLLPLLFFFPILALFFPIPQSWKNIALFEWEKQNAAVDSGEVAPLPPREKDVDLRATLQRTREDQADIKTEMNILGNVLKKELAQPKVNQSDVDFLRSQIQKLDERYHRLEIERESYSQRLNQIK